MTDTVVETTEQSDKPTAIPHWIAGARREGTGRTAPVYNPALGTVVSEVGLASSEEMSEAIASANAVFPAWRDLSIAKRQSIMFRFRELIVQRKDELATIVTREHGKVHSDALGEIARGIEVAELATAFPLLTKGEYSENASTGVDVYSLRQPLGVVGIISPFNFPAMIPLWFAPVALAAGNVVVIKPSEKDPSSAVFIAELFKEAGLPDGVLTVVHGDKEAVDTLLTHPDVQAISFVGSTPIAEYVYRTGSEHGKRVQALGGAKNHMLVLPDADLDVTADAAVNAGFGSAGERCMAISVVVAVDSIADELAAKIKEKMGAIRTGDGTRDNDMGPLITGQHRDKVVGYIQTAADDGADVLVDGRDPEVDGDPNGFWLKPTLIDKVPTDSTAYKEEIFGPVLSIVRVASYEEGLELINANQYGNGTAIFTNDGGAARRFQNEVQVGMVGINVPIPVPVGYHSFGGWKRSIFGQGKAYGKHAFDFYTREKVVTSRWLDPSHGGLNLGFPQHD
ncbi:CoA-acylating methylmalonate-semialdehyde dehydrogenase [Agrococcus sp. ARC_14]|uniref:CoA-acylating methylmalonate-semialdehyde dehydrogenase n=1 Tax=Agrococcus sp. ARC_14 TaxID=2919927 RepID=UPI001F051978|nr:CoA-acylating methylmalonate-semialdehyde dehydrogenase [Agrococcus sp. ARC_14]MCH1882920.1 CoA-acylating methylmalonate-semialdehyde dehydrogenase [Agrococcus sp. ARC_14]